MPHHYISTYHQNHLQKSHPKLKEKEPLGEIPATNPKNRTTTSNAAISISTQLASMF
jgi:hypothetical protein